MRGDSTPTLRPALLLCILLGMGSTAGSTPPAGEAPRVLLVMAQADRETLDVILPPRAVLLEHHAATGLALVVGSSGLWPGALPAWEDVPAKAAGDPLAAYQWGLEAVRAPEAWALAGTVQPALVAVIDSGIRTHEDLHPPSIRRGFDYVDRDSEPDDLSGHGTHVAGIISATRGNLLGIAGAAGAPLLVLRVLDGRDEGSCANVAFAVLEAVDAGARVVNLSLACAGDFPPLRIALHYARLKGALVVASAGNMGAGAPEDCPSVPARYPDVLAVGAVTASDETAAFSCRGAALDFLAPGVHVLSLAGEDRYANHTGTSFAAPFVSALAALVMGVAPHLAPEKVEAILRNSARDVGPPGFDEASGWGVIDMAAAMDAAIQ